MTVHDHFDGSAHCWECQGHCQLSGDALEVTRLTRHTLEYFAYNHKGGLPSFIQDSLTNLLGGERLKTLRNRCLESMVGIHRA